MASSRPGRLLTFDSLQALRPERCDRDHKDGRPPDDADLVVRALAFLEGFAAYPVGAPTAERLPAARYSASRRHLASCPAHRQRRATRRGRPGRPVRASHSRSRNSAPRATGHRRAPNRPRQRRGSHAPGLTGHRHGPTNTSRVSRSLNCSPHEAPLVLVVIDPRASCLCFRRRGYSPRGRTGPMSGRSAIRTRTVGPINEYRHSRGGATKALGFVSERAL